jgi:hypothetical protein
MSQPNFSSLFYFNDRRDHFQLLVSKSGRYLDADKVSRNAMTPPQLPRDAPVADAFHPVKPNVKSGFDKTKELLSISIRFFGLV